MQHAVLLRGLAGPLLEYAKRLTQIGRCRYASRCACSCAYTLEKQSPHKRRSGGRNSSRHCWRDPDDGDATYPAKRTRINRTTAMLLSDDGSPGNDGADVADVDGSEEGKRLLRGD